MLVFKVTTVSVEELERFTTTLIDVIQLHRITRIGLGGILGAGKTTLTKQLLKSFGSVCSVTSPTYVLQNIYELPFPVFDLFKSVEHWDLYRLSEIPDELYEETESLKIIEWFDKFKELDDFVQMTVRIDTGLESKRTFTVEVKENTAIK